MAIAETTKRGSKARWEGLGERTCLMVLGMHRSGTSALAGVLQLLGVAPAKNLIPADESNRTGYWEPLHLALLNEQLLLELGSRWDDWRPVRVEELSASRLSFYRDEIARVLDDEYGATSMIVLKEPRISRIVPVYQQLLTSLRYKTNYITITRNPLSVAKSLAKRDGMDLSFGSLVWLNYVLASEKSTRNSPRVFLSYESMVRDFGPVLDKISERFSLEWPRKVSSVEKEIAAYLSTDHQHHLASIDLLMANDSVPDLVKRAYVAMLDLVEDASLPAATAELDAIHDEFEDRWLPAGQVMFAELLAREAKARLAPATDYAATETRLIGNVRALMSQVDELGGEREALKSKIVAMVENQSRMEGQAVESEIRAERLQLEIVAKSNELAKSISEIANLKAELSIRSAQLTDSRQEIVKYVSQISVLKSDIGALREQCDKQDLDGSTLREQLAASRQEIAKYVSQMSDLEADLGSLTEQYEKRGLDVSTLTGQLAAATESLQTVARELTLVRESKSWKIVRALSKLASPIRNNGADTRGKYK
ncbi:hypothetical protein [Mesorhizobium sp. B2-3-10]|uniref:sulfotransferase family protein n=1 Tax=Mesorhizobium sp. B2-3-10 TaxID=2589954 RepID=UPI00112BFB9F|nr:hypothetical protein [Mesorhizobium sp. B2-3-10]TPL92825.1 hypothetical protein FJ943_27390 [Mesorhizobium sp. B2-3-10]